MKKAFWLLIGLVFFMITVFSTLPCQAQDTIINGCYKIRNGQLRVVTGPQDCKKSERPITWNGNLIPPPDPLTDGPICMEVEGYPDFILKLVFKKMAQDNYTFSGALWDESTPYTMMTGNALVVGNKIYMASHEAGGNPGDFWTSQNLIIFKKETFERIIGRENRLTWDSDSGQVEIHHEEHSINLKKITCP